MLLGYIVVLTRNSWAEVEEPQAREAEAQEVRAERVNLIPPMRRDSAAANTGM